ncbi:MAG: B12-binding domain-containing radical SAM protein [Magnetococcales bacterium]|nr:B12-binding domain-containing radical SAM protein [Magnetococcales bacterium]
MNIVLYYPKMGMSASLVNHMPLSLLYAAIDSLDVGVSVRVVDGRLAPRRWQQALETQIDSQTHLLGISVMSGAPITNALEVSRWCKKHHPHIKIVWGGPHTMFHGREVLNEPSVDFSISGYGSLPLARLCRNLRGDADAPEFKDIPGLNYRHQGAVMTVPVENRFEFIDYKKIPYDLIRANLDRYGQMENAERVFSMYSSMGCPYQCSFCSAPAQYKDIRKKFEIYPFSEVVDHIDHVVSRYGATYIYFIDDDSFVRISHIEAIIDEIQRRGIRVKLGFRGARINEIKKMSDTFLNKLADAGTDIMHIGAESGSQKTLDLIKKNCTVADIIDVNLKMARHPEIKCAYNWIVGLPGETIEDIHETRKLMIRLIHDNPNVILFTPNMFRPLPHTELYEMAVARGYHKPDLVSEWANVENSVEAKRYETLPWVDETMHRQVEMLQIVTNFIDNKIFKIDLGNTLKFNILRFLARLYTPIAWARVRTGYSGLLFEKTLLQWVSRLG